MQFLRHRPDHFVLGYAVGDGLAMATIDEDGTVTTGPAVPIDTSGGKPSELGWLALFPDDRRPPRLVRENPLPAVRRGWRRARRQWYRDACLVIVTPLIWAWLSPGRPRAGGARLR
jgi:hypothetical protein